MENARAGAGCKGAGLGADVEDGSGAGIEVHGDIEDVLPRHGSVLPRTDPEDVLVLGAASGEPSYSRRS